MTDKIDQIRHLLTASTPPSASDDEAHGFARGSLWIDGRDLWACVDASEGKAVWKRCTPPPAPKPKPKKKAAKKATKKKDPTDE